MRIRKIILLITTFVIVAAALSVNASAAHTYTKGKYKWYWDAHPHYKCYQCTMCSEVKEDRSETVKLKGCELCYPTKATITFNANGGTCSTSSKKIDIGGKIGTLPTPTRNGYTFVGWSSSPKSNYHIVNSTFTYDKDTTLYAHWTSGVYNGTKLTFDVDGGLLPKAKLSCGISGYNVPRDTHELIIYNCDGEYVATNYYGYEVAVNANGVVTAKRVYGDNTQLQVPAGGFVVSASGTTSNETAKFVHDIEVGMYVGYDENAGKIYVYSSNDAYLVNHKYVEYGDNYGCLPVPTRSGYVFNGWLDPYGNLVNYFDTHADDYYSDIMRASWTKTNAIWPYAERGYNGKVYQLYDYIMSWEDAREFCEERGGHLVTITNSYEQAVIEELISVGDRGQYFIGATDAVSEGTWKWITGEKFSYSNWDLDYPEPDISPSENCAVIIAKDNPPNKAVGEWMDSSYFDVMAPGFYHISNTGFICEYDNVIKLNSPKVSITNNSSTGKPKLTWTYQTGAMDYRIFRATSKTGKYTHIGTTKTGTYTDTTAKAGKLYYYKVYAAGFVSCADSGYSKIVSRTCDLPRTMVKLSNVVSGGKIKVSWSKVSGAAKYQVYRATSQSGKYTLKRTTTSTSWTDTGTSAGKTYYYKVKVIHNKSAANSAYSKIKSITCGLERPTVSIATSSGKPKVSWKAVAGAKEYKIYRATSKNGTYKAVYTTKNKYWKDTTAKKGKTYYYKVVAVHPKSEANSAYSNIVYKKCTK